MFNLVIHCHTICSTYTRYFHYSIDVCT